MQNSCLESVALARVQRGYCGQEPIAVGLCHSGQRKLALPANEMEEKQLFLNYVIIGFITHLAKRKIELNPPQFLFKFPNWTIEVKNIKHCACADTYSEKNISKLTAKSPV